MREKVLWTLVALGVLMLLWRWWSGYRSPAQLAKVREMLQAGAVLVDVRTAGEFSSGHVRGAVNIPVDQLQGRLGELGGKDKPVIVYCQSGMRSRAAAAQLRAAGFEQVIDIGAYRNAAALR